MTDCELFKFTLDVCTVVSVIMLIVWCCVPPVRDKILFWCKGSLGESTVFSVLVFSLVGALVFMNTLYILFMGECHG